MRKIRACLGLIMVASLFASAVAPADAWWRSSTSSTTGKMFTGELSLAIESATVKCEKTEGEWQIRSTGKISERTKGPGQQSTKEGPHEDLIFNKDNNCTAFGFAGATVTPCIVQAEQPAKSGKIATWSQVNNCIISASGNCELKIAPGPENEHLKAIELETSGSKDILSAKVTGITTTATSLGGLGCLGIKNPKSAVATLKFVATAEGQILV